MGRPVLAFDIGGTTTRAALIDNGVIGARRQIATPRANLARSLLTLARDLDTPVAGVGVGVPEYVHNGRVTSSEVIAWDDELPSVLSEIGPVTVESDVRCAALAEWVSPDSLLYLSWGTGLSTTLVLPNGRAWEGHSGRAIAFGERRMPDGSTLEATASGRGIENRYLDATGTRLATRDLPVADPVVAHLLQEAGVLVAGALLDLARTLDPARVVVGGGLGMAHTAANDALETTWLAAEWNAPPLTRARHGEDAGLIGAAALVR